MVVSERIGYLLALHGGNICYNLKNGSACKHCKDNSDNHFAMTQLRELSNQLENR